MNITSPLPLDPRILKPGHRGRLTARDSAETQWGLVSANNGEGKLYCLVDMKDRMVKKARFLSFGALKSLPILDAFCELAGGRSLVAACATTRADLQGRISDMGAGDADFAFLQDLQAQLLSNIETTVVEPPLDLENLPYQRKAEKDMDERDRAWIPLGAPAKIIKLGEVAARVIIERTVFHPGDISIYDVARDFNVKVRFAAQVPRQQRPTLLQFIAEACRSDLHPHIQVSEAVS